MVNRSDNGKADADIEAILSLQQALMVQARNTSNSTALMAVSLQHIQSDMANLIRSLDATRERRYAEEINAMEHQLEVLQKQLDEKKTALVDTRDTSDKVRAVMQKEAEKNKIDWKVVRQTMVNAAFGAIAVGIVWGIVTNLHIIGAAIKTFFGR